MNMHSYERMVKETLVCPDVIHMRWRMRKTRLYAPMHKNHKNNSHLARKWFNCKYIIETSYFTLQATVKKNHRTWSVGRLKILKWYPPSRHIYYICIYRDG